MIRDPEAILILLPWEFQHSWYNLFLAPPALSLRPFLSLLLEPQLNPPERLSLTLSPEEKREGEGERREPQRAEARELSQRGAAGGCICWKEAFLLPGNQLPEH